VHKVFPAMYIENITDLAFDDVPVEDPDFPFIQGCTAVLSPSCTFCEITSAWQKQVWYLVIYPLGSMTIMGPIFHLTARYPDRIW
jgi:hypothetical protein